MRVCTFNRRATLLLESAKVEAAALARLLGHNHRALRGCLHEQAAALHDDAALNRAPDDRVATGGEGGVQQTRDRVIEQRLRGVHAGLGRAGGDSQEGENRVTV